MKDYGVSTIQEYILCHPKHAQKMLVELHKTIQTLAPDAEECICYGIPTFKLHGNLVHFGAYDTHIGFYPTPSGIQKFAAKLKKYKTSKGAVQFPLDEPLPLTVIQDIVKFRIKENEAKLKEKKAKKKKK